MRLCLMLVLMGVCCVGSVNAAVFIDDFEGTSLDPFWTPMEQSGAITFPSTAMSRSGSQSLQTNSTANTGQKNVGVYHDFATPVFGTFSVWIFDTGAGVGSSNYIGLNITHEPGGIYSGASAYDYATSTYRAVIENVGVWSSVARTRDWHQFEFSVSPTSTVVSIDGVTAMSQASGTPITRVHLNMSGPSWRPAWEAYYDDFSAEFSPVNDNAVPEPTSIALWSILGVLGLVAVRRCKR